VETVLELLSGIAWTVVYIEAIRLGFSQRTYAIPIAALALNISWEWTYTTLDLAQDPAQAQTWINLAWALADSVILCTYFRFGRQELPAFVTKPLFAVWGVGVVATSFLVQWLFIAEFGLDDRAAPSYSAFLQNLLMSGLFIAMFVGRRGPRGQSLVVAVAKWVGTLAPTIVFGILRDSSFILGLGILCSIFDLAYIAILVGARRNPVANTSTLTSRAAAPVPPTAHAARG
jgi:hypothetical protein